MRSWKKSCIFSLHVHRSMTHVFSTSCLEYFVYSDPSIFKASPAQLCTNLLFAVWNMYHVDIRIVLSWISWCVFGCSTQMLPMSVAVTQTAHSEAFSSDFLSCLKITSCFPLFVCVCIWAGRCVHASLMGLQVPALWRTEPVAILVLKEGDQMAWVGPWASGLTPCVWYDRLPVNEPDPPAKTLLQRIAMN